jgi:hypothetical protein
LGGCREYHVQCGGIGSWEWRNGGAIYLVNQSSHILFINIVKVIDLHQD